jgi:hypothetical protein
MEGRKRVVGQVVMAGGCGLAGVGVGDGGGAVAEVQFLRSGIRVEQGACDG